MPPAAYFWSRCTPSTKYNQINNTLVELTAAFVRSCPRPWGRVSVNAVDMIMFYLAVQSALPPPVFLQAVRAAFRSLRCAFYF